MSDQARSSDSALLGALVVGGLVWAAGALVTWMLAGGLDEALLRTALQVTGRMSFLVFFASLVARPAAHWGAPGAGTLFRRRRELGLMLAGGQVTHALLIVALLYQAPQARLAPIAVLGGLAGYLFLAVMALASFSWGARRLSPPARAAVFSLGTAYLVVLFTYDLLLKPMLMRRLSDRAYWPFTLLLAVGVALRWPLTRRSRSPDAHFSP